MYADLRNYEPKHVDYVISDDVRDMFPQELDFSEESVNRVMNIVAGKFSATFPDAEAAFRKLDDFEVKNIREEYCELTENEVPKRLLELEETLERVKAEKKKAEEAYQSVLLEVQKYAAEVKKGVREIRLSPKKTFCIALRGYYVVYTWDNEKKCMRLAKAFEIPDRSEVWAIENKNREAMSELFGIDFPDEPVNMEPLPM